MDLSLRASRDYYILCYGAPTKCLVLSGMDLSLRASRDYYVLCHGAPTKCLVLSGMDLSSRASRDYYVLCHGAPTKCLVLNGMDLSSRASRDCRPSAWCWMEWIFRHGQAATTLLPTIPGVTARWQYLVTKYRLDGDTNSDNGTFCWGDVLKRHDMLHEDLTALLPSIDN